MANHLKTGDSTVAVNMRALFSSSPQQAIQEAIRNGNGNGNNSKHNGNGTRAEGKHLIEMLHTLQERERTGIEVIRDMVIPVYRTVVDQNRPLQYGVPSKETIETIAPYMPKEELERISGKMRFIADPVVQDVGSVPDGVIKRKEQPLDTGLAMVTAVAANTGLAFIESEPGHKEDLQRIILGDLDPTGLLARKHSQVIPFNGRKIEVGTWQKLNYIDPNAVEHPEEPMRFYVTIFESTNHVLMRKKIRNGSPTAAKDITDDVEKVVEGLGVKNGVAVVFGMHTTIGTALMKPENVDNMIHLLNTVAPNDLDPNLRFPYQHHLNVNDGNGHSHIQSLLMGTTVLVPVKDGKVNVGERRIMAFDFDDNQAPRERGFTITVIKDNSEERSLLRE